jgi:hypothetical protein
MRAGKCARSQAGSQPAARNSKFFAAYFSDHEGARTLFRAIELFHAPTELPRTSARVVMAVICHNTIICLACAGAGQRRVIQQTI